MNQLPFAENHPVCTIFPQACELLAPYLDSEVKTISDFALVHMLHDHFPELSNNEVYLVLSTAERVHHEKRMQAILTLNGN